MSAGLLKTIALSVTLVCSLPAACAADLTAGAVAAPDQYGAKVAAHILQAGGNAVDAAVATAFTLAVTYPEAGNIGGGGFMTLYVDGKPYFLDYREVAPKAAGKTMYLNEKGEVIENLSLVGSRAAGVPGTVLGLWEAHKRFGKLPWAELLTPAIGYARQGFTVADQQYQYREDANKLFAGKTNFGDYFGAMKPGTVFKQPELAATLERIAKSGADDFYHGETARLLVAQMQRDNGLIGAADLADYRVKWREPMRISWRGNTVYTAPLPSSGGRAEGHGLHPRRPGLEHGGYSGHPHRWPHAGNRVRSARPRRGPGSEEVTPRRPVSGQAGRYSLAAAYAEIRQK